jgi:hypothetical protein
MSSFVIGIAASLPEVALIKWPKGSFPQPHRSVSLVELVRLVLLLAKVPRMFRPISPPSCRGAAKQFNANSNRIKTNTIEYLISLTYNFFLLGSINSLCSAKRLTA